MPRLEQHLQDLHVSIPCGLVAGRPSPMRDLVHLGLSGKQQANHLDVVVLARNVERKAAADGDSLVDRHALDREQQANHIDAVVLAGHEERKEALCGPLLGHHIVHVDAQL